MDVSAEERVIADQLDAYNARDIERFMAHWAGDAQLFAFPDTLLADGAEAIKARHIERFQDKNLKAELRSRVRFGHHVIDSERVTRTFAQGVGSLDVVAIYHVVDGKIKAAWFIFGEPVFSADIVVH